MIAETRAMSQTIWLVRSVELTVPPRGPVVSWPLRAAIVGGVAACILVASVVDPGGSVPRTLFGVGITVPFHLIGYAALSGTLGYALAAADRRTLVLAVVLATLYGAGIELLQGMIPARTMAVGDVLLNFAGAILGSSVWWGVAPWFGVERGNPDSDERVGR